MTQKTITEILHSCEVGELLTNNTFTWEVTSRYQEDNQLIVIASPIKEQQDHPDSFELWSCGVENYSHMPNLKKI
jgi:hypothetical protein